MKKTSHYRRMFETRSVRPYYTTAHAAIISRELKIPCIIGTKIATKVLKDGDMVEVDAERGVVKILERSGTAKNDNESRDGKK